MTPTLALLLALLPLALSRGAAQSPLCPDSPDRASGDSSLFRFHKQTRRCYEAGEKGPCPSLMRFYAQDNTFGTCDCDHTLRCGRPLIFWAERERCYPVYTQGPCREGKWLVFGFDLQPVCKKNVCEREEEESPSVGGKYWLTTANHTCHKTSTRGPCADPQQLLYNMDLHYRATCQKQPACGLLQRLTNLSCYPGQRLDVLGRCARKMASVVEGKKGVRLPLSPPATNVYCLFCDTRSALPQ